MVKTPEFTINRVFELYGQAAYSLHVFELGLLDLRALVYCAEVKSCVIRKRTPTKLSVDKATCGKLVRQIDAKWKLPKGFREHLDAYVDKRNDVVHHFFRRRGLDILSETGRAEMVAELAIYIVFFETALQLVEILRSRILRELEWRDEMWDEAFERWIGEKLRPDALKVVDEAIRRNLENTERVRSVTEAIRSAVPRR